MKEYRVNINGIDVDAQYTEENIRDIFLPLLRYITRMQNEKGRRVLVMLAAPPGAGKSTLLSFLETLAESYDDIGAVQTIGMDGFHKRQEYLLAHTTIRDGKEIPLVKIKGAPVTFDLEKMKKAVKKILSGDICGWPLYDRHRHNPSEDAIKVEKDIVILEGNYLLLDEEGWDELSNLADLTVMVRADLKMIKDRLIKRRIASGHPEEDAEEFVEYSDMYNARLVLEHSGEADLTLFIRADGSYEVYEDKANVL